MFWQSFMRQEIIRPPEELRSKMTSWPVMPMAKYFPSMARWPRRAEIIRQSTVDLEARQKAGNCLDGSPGRGKQGGQR
jgi:hypothetical protein